MEPNLLGRLLGKTKTVQRLVALDALLNDAHYNAYRARFHSLQPKTAQFFIDRHREIIDTFNYNKFWWMAKRKYAV
ncbi:hypothetical protein AAY80_092 [Stenotrophomonas phage vB_SmaS-DLP_6]|nr:hypothetical protein AAY80_092 [Stenotrophomonas phage vB_SmaS-DLP_6]